MAEVKFEKASRIYPGTEVPAVNELDLEIHEGELLVLVGPSGSGKSTALRMLAGLEPTDKGRIYIGGRDVSLTPPQDRDIAMVFQSYALYPQMTVAENMGFALKQQKVPKDERRRRVEEAGRILDLTPYLDRKPKALSGGQRQRVAMGRAIVREPQVFLMDEPLSNLDAKLRVQTRMEVSDLQARLGVTTAYVTHDQVEAMTMGHRVAVLKDGILQQVDRPRTLYSHPNNLFVAGFIGSPAMNLLPITPADGRFEVSSVPVPIAPDVQQELQNIDYMVGVRPEHLSLGAEGIPGEVVVVEELGSEAYLHVKIVHQAKEVDLVVRSAGETDIERGNNVHIRFNGPTHVFEAESGRRLGAVLAGSSAAMAQ